MGWATPRGFCVYVYALRQICYNFQTSASMLASKIELNGLSTVFLRSTKSKIVSTRSVMKKYHKSLYEAGLNTVTAKHYFDVLEFDGWCGCHLLRYECDVDDVLYIKEQLAGERLEEEYEIW